jgi:hypothetical protein
VPDEHSNLNVSPSARRPPVRRRGRRGGRGRARAPRSPADKADAAAEELPPASAPAGEAVAHDAVAEPEGDTSGDFREPHSEEPGDSSPPEEISHGQADAHAEPAPEAVAEPVAEVRTPKRDPGPERRPERPYQPERRRPEPKPWTKPADFRPAETSAISQAVALATEIAGSLKEMTDQLDEILELVELAERQKIADEREIDELHRALRRIQPPRHQQNAQRGPRHDEPHRGQREQGQRDHGQRHVEPRPSETAEPPPQAD